MKTLLKYKSNGLAIYYKFECDDKNRPSDIETDLVFELTEIEKLDSLICRCERLKLEFNLYVEVFNEQTSEILIKQYLERNKKQINPCGICGEDNPAHNFGCYNCGSPLDLEINTNDFGLPEIDQTKNPFEL